jgi:hypothetical protein
MVAGVWPRRPSTRSLLHGATGRNISPRDEVPRLPAGPPLSRDTGQGGGRAAGSSTRRPGVSIGGKSTGAPRWIQWLPARSPFPHSPTSVVPKVSDFSRSGTFWDRPRQLRTVILGAARKARPTANSHLARGPRVSLRTLGLRGLAGDGSGAPDGRATNDRLYARGYHSKCPDRRQVPRMSQCSSFGGSRPYSRPNSTCVPTVKAEKSGKSFTLDQLFSRDRR